MRFKTKLGAGLAAATVVAVGAWAAVGLGGPAGAADTNGQVTATGPTVPGGTWGLAQPVPGVAALTPSGYTPGSAGIAAITCTTAGNCTAVGSYAATKGIITTQWPIIVTETAGVWGSAQLVSGIGSLGTGTAAWLARVSCGAPGDCSAAGLFAAADGKSHGFLVTEAAGSWGTATAIDDSGLGTSQVSVVTALSCRAAGDCTAIGSYAPDSGTIVDHAFTMDESNGTWGGPQPVAGLDALLSGTVGGSGVLSLSCAAPGDCTAGGGVSDGTVTQPLLVSESNGSWGDAQAVPGFQALPGAVNGAVRSVSCPDSGDCAAIGIFSTATSSLPFIIDEAGGTWGTAHPLSLPSGAKLNAIPTVACWAAGNCTVMGGLATSAPVRGLVFAATETSGTWRSGQPVPGLPATVSSSFATALSCAPAGECTIAGWYAATGVAFQAFTVTSSASGSIGILQPLPAAYGHNRSTTALSCPQPGYCAMAVNAPAGIALVNEATAATVTLTASAPSITYGSEQSETLTATASSPAGGTPTGTVTVTGATGATACVITLRNGTGNCTLGATALPGASDTATATYSGDASYLRATSTAKVAVAPASVTVSFTVSPAVVTYTSKNLTFTFNIGVTSAAGIPNGTAGGIIGAYGDASSTCPATLVAGKVTCTATVPPTAGRYPVVVNYGGGANFLGATSATQYVTVARAKTSTGLTLSAATITYGHENAERLTVSASHLSGSYSTGKVTIKAGTTVLCTISLSKSGGSCVLSTTRLKAGTYRLTATYSGDVNYAPSTSVVRILKVIA